MDYKLWYFLIDGQENSETGIFGNFYAYGSHLGDALEKTIKVAVEYNIYNPDLIEASILEDIEQVDNREDLIEINDMVYMNPTTHAFPSNDPDKTFIPPIGIVKSVDDGEYDYDLIKESFVAYDQNEKGIYELEIVVGKTNLIDLFLKSIHLLPSIDTVLIYIQSFWENENTELWAAKQFTNSEFVTEFLKKNLKDTLENGNIRIVINSLAGETNLILDDHKIIQLHTRNESLFRYFIGNYMDWGYEQTEDFYSLEYGFHHWHYRPAGSLTRIEFKNMLNQNQFELLDSWEE